MKAFILLSGGIDSMACVNFYKALYYEVECIFCDYSFSYGSELGNGCA